MMNIEYKKLLSLLEDFYELTSIKICVFDENYKEITHYPERFCPFCDFIRKNPKIEKKCTVTDQFAFEHCKKTGERFVYQCHMNLTESVTPIKYNGLTIGYIMIGQILCNDSLQSNSEELRKLLKRYEIPEEEAIERYRRILNIDLKKINAASHILDACASYLYYAQVVHQSANDISAQIDNYIAQHLTEELSVDQLCRTFHLSRVQLYSVFSDSYNASVAAFIKKQRLEKAKKLLISSELSVAAVAAECGLLDYTYFSKQFKIMFGQSPLQFRNEFKKNENTLLKQKILL